MHYKRTAKSCGPDIPTLISGATRERCHPRRQQSPVSGASTKEAVKTIAQGRPGRSGEPVVNLSACFPFLHAELRVHRAPGFPCALDSRVAHFCARLGRIVSREARIRGLRLARSALTIVDREEHLLGTNDVARLSQAPVIASVNQQRSIRARTEFSSHGSVI